MRTRTRTSRRAVLALAGLLVLGGGAAVVVGAVGDDGPDQPALVASADAAPPAEPAAPAPPAGAPAQTTAPDPPPDPAQSVAAPSTLTIDSIGVSSPLITLGLADDGTIAVPQPGPDYDSAAWFDGSPRPGAVGPSVIEGHVDSAKGGPSVFYRLGDLEVGDEITVAREDGGSTTFAVTGSQRYAKDDFPTLAVYGNTERPELRLITCGGPFDASTGHYRDNTVVFARAV